jgi:hypothetical protein
VVESGTRTTWPLVLVMTSSPVVEAGPTPLKMWLVSVVFRTLVLTPPSAQLPPSLLGRPRRGDEAAVGGHEAGVVSVASGAKPRSGSPVRLARVDPLRQWPPGIADRKAHVQRGSGDVGARERVRERPELAVFAAERDQQCR